MVFIILAIVLNDPMPYYNNNFEIFIFQTILLKINQKEYDVAKKEKNVNLNSQNNVLMFFFVKDSVNLHDTV